MQQALIQTTGAGAANARRISNTLVPYDELDETSREYNRAHVRDIPRLLAQAGLAIVR